MDFHERFWVYWSYIINECLNSGSRCGKIFRKLVLVGLGPRNKSFVKNLELIQKTPQKTVHCHMGHNYEFREKPQCKVNLKYLHQGCVMTILGKISSSGTSGCDLTSQWRLLTWKGGKPHFTMTSFISVWTFWCRPPSVSPRQHTPSVLH